VPGDEHRPGGAKAPAGSVYPVGRGFRYLIAEGPESLEVYIRAFVDSCATFPSHPVLLTADWGNHTELLLAQRYSALPAFFGA